MAGLLSALPWLLGLSFLVLPTVSSAAVRAFACEHFDSGRAYLRADYALECTTPEHTSQAHEATKAIAWLGIGLYPVGVSVAYAALLLRTRRAVLDGRATALTEALGFLVRDYKPAYLWWELLETWKKLALVGLAALVRRGSIYQLVAAFFLSLVSMLLTSVAMPFKADADNAFAKACGFALAAVFLFALVLKVRVLAEAADAVLTVDLRERYVFDAALGSVGMVTAIVGVLALAALVALHQLAAAVRSAPATPETAEVSPPPPPPLPAEEAKAASSERSQRQSSRAATEASEAASSERSQRRSGALTTPHLARRRESSRSNGSLPLSPSPRHSSGGGERGEHTGLRQAESEPRLATLEARLATLEAAVVSPAQLLQQQPPPPTPLQAPPLRVFPPPPYETFRASPPLPYETFRASPPPPPPAPPPPPPPPPEEAKATPPELLKRRSSRALTPAEEEERRELRAAEQALPAPAYPMPWPDTH